MPILLHEQKIAFFNVPKVGSTSVKELLYNVSTGRDFDAEEHGTHIHLALREELGCPERVKAEYPDYWKVAVVRDPMQRILSAYANRVIDMRDHLKQRRSRLEQGKARLKLMVRRLPPLPAPNLFFARLDDYRALDRSIRSHTDPLAVFLGRQMAELDRVYKLEEISQFADDLSVRTGKKVMLGHSKAGGTKVRPADLSPGIHNALLLRLAGEYSYLGGLYPMPAFRPT